MSAIRNTKTTNKALFDTIRNLKKLSNTANVSVYRAVAEKLAASASRRAEVNLSKLNKVTKEGEKVIIPGKILGDGKLDKKITIISATISESAKKKIENSGSTYYSIDQYISQKQPDHNIRIIV